MGRKLFYAFALLFLAFAVASTFVLARMLFGQGQGSIPESAILTADFTSGLVEYVPEDPIAKALLQQRGTVRETVAALERAAEDERVVALVARVGTGFGLPGKVQELRDAVLHFRGQGKRAIAYVETFGAGYAGTTNYYLATAFDEIYLLPLGSVSLAGLALEVRFLRGAFDKLGIEPQLRSRGEYKTAKSTYTDTELSAANREAYSRIVESQFERIGADIAYARNLTHEQLEEIASRGTLQSPDALAAGLIDGIAYRDEVFAMVEEAAPESAERLGLDAYWARLEGPSEDSPVIALIYGVGGVVQGKSRYDPLTGSTTMGSDTVAAALRAAAEDDEVRAIVFRIDSGGGSAVASQVMWRETLRAQQEGKPVIASMGDVAGSGGYFIAMGANKIVAQPGTITGSIGVLGGKLVTKQLWDKLGISFDGVRTHRNSDMWSSSREFTPEQWESLDASLDRVYKLFTEGVALGREMPIEKVLEAAQGRIWTGADALELGLVDALGGFPAAIRLAKEAAGIDPDAPVELRLFPRERGPLALVVDALTGRRPPGGADAIATLLTDALEGLRPLGRIAAQLGLVEPYGVLQMQVPAILLGP